VNSIGSIKLYLGEVKKGNYKAILNCTAGLSRKLV